MKWVKGLCLFVFFSGIVVLFIALYVGIVEIYNEVEIYLKRLDALWQAIVGLILFGGLLIFLIMLPIMIHDCAEITKKDSDEKKLLIDKIFNL
jgi:hypothetical protein